MSEPTTIIETILEKQRAIALGCADKSVEELTDEERVAICVAAGVPMHTQGQPDGRLLILTTYPVGFMKLDGKFKVLVDSRPVAGHTMTFTMPDCKRVEEGAES